ncbi:hypothetical protein FRC17_010320, partial [Serendipita sp. 399]
VDLATAPDPQLGVCMQSLARELHTNPIPNDESGRWWWSASVTTGEGMQQFVNGMLHCIRTRLELDSESCEGKREPLIRHARQRMHMENAAGYLEQFLRGMDGEDGRLNVVLGAEELRYAAREIGQITRTVTVDDVLDAPSRSYAPAGAADEQLQPPSADPSSASSASAKQSTSKETPDTVDEEAEKRAARRSQYYSAASDPRLRKEWEEILRQDPRSRSGRPRSAGAGYGALNSVKRSSSLSSSVYTAPLVRNGPSTPSTNPQKDEDDKDEFFTPHTSPQASPSTAALDLATVSSSMQSLNVAAADSSRLSQQSRQTRDISNTSSNSSYSSYASSVASSDANYSNYSWGTRTGSEDTHITVASSRASRHSKHSSDPTSEYGSATPDWAKEMRRLVPYDGTAPYASRRANSEPSNVSVTSSRSRSSRSSGSSRRSKTEPIRPRARRRMSEIQEEVEDDGDDVSRSSRDEDGPLNADGMTRTTQVSPLGMPQRRKSQSSQSRPNGRKQSLGTHSETSSVSSTRTVDLPSLVPHAEPATYTSFVFPRTSYQPSKHPDRITNSVDIVHSGVGSTTMSTISITKHGAEILNRNRKFYLPGLMSPRNSTDTPSHLLEDGSPIVSLSSHTPTPSKIQSNQVLVHVCCVALDGIDVLITREKSKSADGYGFVPGRGFCGRIIEAGLGVSNVRKGDWVVGLLDLTKSGALSEFVIVDKRRVHRSPIPTSSLTAEHLAVLAVSGVAAHRATSTIPGPVKDSRILVLQAHDGAGALATQELVADGAKVTVQIPNADQVEKLRGLNLESIKVGTPLAVLESLAGEEGPPFNAVLDTVGGKDIWEACKRILGATGQFTTLVGDSPEAVLSFNAHVKSNMRSLKLAFRKSDNKSIGYEWVSPSAEVDQEGNDIRDSLAAACSLATNGYVRPRISSHLIATFERAPDILNGTRKNSPAAELMAGAVAVVRLQ